MEYIMIEKDKINGKEVYHRCSTKREENEGSRQWTYYICDNCKEHPSNSTYLGRSTQHYIINRQNENKHIFCTDKEYQEKKVKKQMNDEVTKGSNGQMNYTSGQGGGGIPIIIKTRWGSDDPIKQVVDHSDTYIAILEQDIKDLNQELKDLKEGMQHDMRKHPIKAECQTKHQFAFRVQGEAVVRCQECYKCLNDEQYFTGLEDENKLLKSQLAELHQANVNLFNESKKLKKDRVKCLENNKIVYDYTERSKHIKLISELQIDNHELKEQLELKETINQDLVKKYKLLEEEIQAYDINMLELVESYKKLEQDYNDSKERLKIKGEVLSNLTAHTNELEYKYKELEQEVNQLNSILRKENKKIKFANLFPERFIKLPFKSFCNPEIIGFLAKESFKEKYIQYTIKISEKEFKKWI